VGKSARIIRCAIAAITVAGCSSDSRSCTLAVLSSGIGLVVEDTGWTVVEFCINEDCSPTSETVSDEPDDYVYRLSLRRPEGSIIEHDGVVETRPHRVNGEGCPPLTANAVLTVDNAGTVTISHLSS
jgi:hypothetical protein